MTHATDAHVLRLEAQLKAANERAERIETVLRSMIDSSKYAAEHNQNWQLIAESAQTSYVTLVEKIVALIKEIEESGGVNSLSYAELIKTRLLPTT